MKYIINYIIRALIIFIILAVTIPFKILSMLYYWEGIDYRVVGREGNTYFDMLKDLTETIISNDL